MWALGILSPSLPLHLVSQLCSVFRSLALRPASVLGFLSPTPLFLSYEDFCGAPTPLFLSYEDFCGEDIGLFG